MGKTTIQIDVEVRETLRALAESSWEPVNETLRRILEMPSSDPTVGQGEDESNASPDS